jgi:hypothetical protein
MLGVGAPEFVPRGETGKVESEAAVSHPDNGGDGDTANKFDVESDLEYYQSDADDVSNSQGEAPVGTFDVGEAVSISDSGDEQSEHSLGPGGLQGDVEDVQLRVETEEIEQQKPKRNRHKWQTNASPRKSSRVRRPPKFLNLSHKVEKSNIRVEEAVADLVSFQEKMYDFVEQGTPLFFHVHAAICGIRDICDALLQKFEV